MQIKKLYIKAFGKIKNAEIPFISGLNVFCENNGFGKTTTAAFVRAMLYGFDYRKMDRVAVKDAEFYRPWDDAGDFGGYMEFEHENKLYRLERYFASTQKNEKAFLTEIKTGQKLSVENLGERFLGVTAETFDRSAYLPQESVELNSNADMEKRLTGLVEGGEESKGYDVALEKLKEHRKNIKYWKGSGGSLYEAQNKLLSAERKKIAAKQEATEQESINTELKRIEVEKKEVSAQIEEAEQKLAMLQRKAAEQSEPPSAESKRAELAELEKRLESCNYRELKSDLRSLAELKIKTSDVSAEVPQVKASRLILIAVLSAILLIAAVIMFVLKQNVLGCVAIFCALAGGFVTLWSLYADKKRKKDIRLKADEQRELVRKFVGICAKYIAVENKRDIDAMLAEMDEVDRNYSGDFSRAEALKSVLPAQKPSQNFHAEISESEAYKKLLTKKKEELARQEGQLSQKFQMLCKDSIAEINENIEYWREREKTELYRLSVADETINLLEQAKTELSGSYLPKLCKRTGDLLNFVTESSYEVAIDRAFVISLMENGQTQALSRYSRGIREITALCFKIALSELLFNGKIPFLMIDDAFVNFDELNFQKACTLIQNLSEKCQVIYFTCHKRGKKLIS